MKHLTQILAGGLTAAALLGLLARPCLGQGEPPTVGFTFEKWLATPGPAPYVATFEGSVAGDVNGRLVTRVLERVQDGDTVTLKAHYVVYGSHDPSAAPLLVAEVAGQQFGTHAQLAGTPPVSLPLRTPTEFYRVVGR